MSLKYSLVMLLLAAGCGTAGWLVWDVAGWGAGALGYAGVSFAVLGVAYAGAGPGLLLKRANGRRAALAWPLFAPYFLLNAAVFAFYRRWSAEPPFAAVAPNLFFGRRLSAREAALVPWANVLDLAAEFPEARPLRQRQGYRSLPTLDGTAPTEAQLRDAVAWLQRAVASGPVYVHCALGHGRSACVVIAYLLSARLVGTVAEGADLLRSLRPGVRLNRAQRRRLGLK